MSWSAANTVYENFVLTGNVGAYSFIPWIKQHADKLGLESAVTSYSESRLEISFKGPRDLLDAMEMGCSLGPFEVWVEEIKRTVVDQK
jgi:acylphosphatase